jgi:uncharacterized circularly permuted ATP-grasp superfamily protein
VTLANAIGTGVADDKSIYPYVPDMIRFYLAKSRSSTTCRPTSAARRKTCPTCWPTWKAGGQGSARRRRLRHAGRPGLDQAEIEDFRARIIAKPDGYIAQPTLALSACPTYVESGIAPRHIDLRPFVLSGKQVTMVPGGLTRVA